LSERGEIGETCLDIAFPASTVNDGHISGSVIDRDLEFRGTAPEMPAESGSDQG
jgi:hypothetical protein